MAVFLKHESCPNCGSKDNLARYDDNSAYCFGCKYVENKTQYTPKNDQNIEQIIKLPENSSTQIGKKGLEWLDKYEITPEERIRYRMLWSEDREQLIFPIYNGTNNVIAWQGRNFKSNAKSKYFSQGKIHDILYLCGNKKSPIIIVEDLVSAIKVSRVCSSMPLFGSEASTSLLMRLKLHCESIIVWLDSDKWKNSQDIVNRARSIGLAALAVYTTQDPKEYDTNKIKYFLTN
jgi:ribosomal protein S27AE